MVLMAGPRKSLPGLHDHALHGHRSEESMPLSESALLEDSPVHMSSLRTHDDQTPSIHTTATTASTDSADIGEILPDNLQHEPLPHPTTGLLNHGWDSPTFLGLRPKTSKKGGSNFRLYLRRHRTFLVSVSLCLLAWIIFTVVTLYTLANLQAQWHRQLELASSQCPCLPGTLDSGRKQNEVDRLTSNNCNCTKASSAAPTAIIPMDEKKDKEPEVCTTFQCVTTAARLISAMDFNVDPCEDFFNYACANWNKEHIIPDDRTSISTFEVMADKLQIQLRRLLEDTSQNGKVQDNSTKLTSQNISGDAMKKAKVLFASCMNVTQIEVQGDQPLRDLMRSYGHWPVATSLSSIRTTTTPISTNPGPSQSSLPATNMSVEELLASIHRDLNIVIVIDQWVGPDDKDSEKHILQIDQPDFALPSRDHYVNPQWAKDLEAYLQYMVDIAAIFGRNSETSSGRVDKTIRRELRQALQLEIDLANASSPESERQATRSALYNKMTLVELQQETPSFNWSLYFRTLLGYSLNSTEPIVAYGLPYLKSATTIIRRYTRRQLWNYALWRVAMELVPHLSSAYLEARANFHKVLMGVSQQRARWQQCIDFVNEKMGMATGALFIREHFNQQSKDKALEMIHMIRESFIEMVDEQTWMESETSNKAREKAQFMNEKIGYPNFLLNTTALNKEYEALIVTDDVFVVNVARILGYQSKKNVDRLRQPVDAERWTTSGPAIVNAFYNPNKNDIVFPAGILQPPFYSASYPRSMNFGGIGVVVGHEISHGFDMKGRQFDRYGNLKEWWNNVTAEAFYRKAECFVDQYSQYIVDEVGLHVDGRLTLGENIADNGGLKQAYRAYHRWVARNGAEERLPGSNLTHDQLFFLNYAQIWCGSMRIQDAMNKISASVHSPGPIRVLGPLSNMPEFSKAFSCPAGSRYNQPAHRQCSLW
ncbi:hypothetical protein RvY_14837 [Ramazzottius varieornatus]|uniref:Peptidase M13 N-terminal domain-containing protein n=1 Tax=Ramazzottius varieornatus TaxID=947166 RepID=A0A1D1VSS5_RAMVA|nr:hypothetical protein RvY_14837 [Ramazzottius varieornatus]